MKNKLIKLMLACTIAFSTISPIIYQNTTIQAADTEAVYSAAQGNVVTITDGTNAIVGNAADIEVLKSLDNFTMNAKLKVTGTGSVQTVFFLGNSNANLNYVNIWLNKSNTVGCEIYNASGTKVLGSSKTSSVAFNDNNEHIFTFRYTKGGQFEVFIDGVKGAEMATNVSFSNGHFDNTATMYLGLGKGQRASGNNYPFSGTISNVKCYNRAISDAEIAQYVEDNKELSSLVYKVHDVISSTEITNESVLTSLSSLSQGSITVRYKAKNANATKVNLFKLANNNSNYAEVYVNPSENKVGYATANKTMEMAKVGTGANDASLTLNDTKWHTFCVHMNGTRVSFYLDDVQFASNIYWTYSQWLSAITNPTSLRLGDDNVYIESIRVHNAQLTANEFDKIQSQYAFVPELIDGMENAYVTEPIDIFYPGYDGSSAYRIPSLLTTDKGTVIAAIDQRYTGTGDAGNIDTAVRRREKGSDEWQDLIDVVDLVDNNGSTPSAFMIDPSMVQDRETGRIFLLVDMYPHSSGLMNTGILVSGDGYEEIDGIEYQEVFKDTVKFGTIREDGIVYDNDGNKTDYVVIRECEAPYKELGNVYYKGEYAGNAFIYDGNNKGAVQIARTSYLWLTYSDDDGKTWSCPKDITPMIKHDFQGFLGTGPGVGIQLADGTLCFPVYGARNENLGGSQASAIIYSTDGGNTWTQGESPITAYATPLDPATFSDSSKIVTESQAVQLNNGDVKLFMRNYSGTVRVATSTDGGKTWDKIENTPIYDCYCQLSVIHYNNNGKEYVLMSNPGASGRNVGAINLGEVDENGNINWTHKNIIEPGRYLYSCLTLLDKDEDGDQVFGLIYEHEPSGMYLKYVEFDEKWITNEEVYSTRPNLEVEDYNVEVLDGNEYQVTLTFNQPVISVKEVNLVLDDENETKLAMSRRVNEKTLVFKGVVETTQDVLKAVSIDGILENEVGETANVNFVVAEASVQEQAVVMSGAQASTQASASTAEGQDGAASNAIDGNPKTYWHSRYTATDSLPQEIVITLETKAPIYKLSYLPRQNSQSGRVKDYEIYVSEDGQQYTKVASGTFTTGTDQQSVEFVPVDAKYVKFVALTSTAKESCAIAEIELYAYQDGLYEPADSATTMSLIAMKTQLQTLQADQSYSTASKAGLANALESVNRLVSALNPFSEKMGENVLSQANKAIDQLVDITAVKALYEEAISKNKKDGPYTQESWDAYQNAIANMEQIIDQATTTRSLTDVTMKVKYAESLLVIEEVSVDKSGLWSAIEPLPPILEMTDKYTAESLANLKAAYEKAVEVYNDVNATQEEVNAVKANLVAAEKALELKPVIVAPNKVENVVATDTDYKTITLTWDVVEGATAYDVYRKSYKEGAGFELVDTVSETTYESVGVMTGKTYSFYVVAKNAAGEAQASETVEAATTLQGEVNLAIEQVSTAKFKLSWNKVDGATRYIVYRKRNDDKMLKVLTLGAEATEYVTAEMPNGDYTFQVRAGRYDSKDRVMTAASNKVNGSVEALKPSVTLKAGSKSATVSWKKMEGVTHYIVYRATSDKYTKLATTKELSYTAKSLTSGKKYYFKVRGYKTYKSGTELQYTVYTPYSSAKAITAK